MVGGREASPRTSPLGRERGNGAARYFDHAATTPVDPRVIEEMLPYFGEYFGNANSIHGFGTRAMAGVDRARARVATLIGAEDPSQITFTSGATEVNNWVASAFEHGAISPFEHDAMREPATRRGFRILDNEGVGILAPKDRQGLISVMRVNNEIGSIWDPADLRAYTDFLHSDMTQAVGKISTSLAGLDYASFSAHKFYGPKGVGGLYSAEGPPATFMMGGEQEFGHRGGTLNVAGIVGMGAAAAIAEDEMTDNLVAATNLREIVLDGLRRLADWRVNGGAGFGREPSPRPSAMGRERENEVSPYILSLSLLGILGESLVVELDRQGFAISAGAACSSRSTEPSHVLTALGMDREWREGTVRISFGGLNTRESAAELAQTLLITVEKLRTLS